MRILITGGAGFIGANLTRELLGHGHRVDIVDNLSTGRLKNLSGTGISPVIGSITDEELMKELVGPADAIVHLAARSSVPRSLDDPFATHVANATGTLTVLEAARLAGGRHVVVASSSSVYGANKELPKNEAGLTRPMSPYAASKLAAESYALGYGTSFGLPTLAFRFFNVFGPLQPAQHAYAAVIPAFVHAALNGEPLVVHGDGSQSRDFTTVGTVCRTLRAAVERQVTSASPVNLAFGSRIDLLTVIEHLGQMLELPLVIQHEAGRVGDVPHSQADPTLLKELFPEVEPVDFEAGLVDTIDWMKTQLEPVIDLDQTLTR